MICGGGGGEGMNSYAMIMFCACGSSLHTSSSL